MSATILSRTNNNNSVNDSIAPPRYITINGEKVVVYTLEEDKLVITKLIERRYLLKELESCDSLIEVYIEREQFREILEDDLKEQIVILKDKNEITNDKVIQLENTLKAIEKKNKAKKTTVTVLAVIGVLLTGGLLLIAFIKK